MTFMHYTEKDTHRQKHWRTVSKLMGASGKLLYKMCCKMQYDSKVTALFMVIVYHMCTVQLIALCGTLTCSQ